MAWLGKLDEAGRLGVQQAADTDAASPVTQQSLFAEEFVGADARAVPPAVLMIGQVPDFAAQ